MARLVRKDGVRAAARGDRLEHKAAEHQPIDERAEQDRARAEAHQRRQLPASSSRSPRTLSCPCIVPAERSSSAAMTAAPAKTASRSEGCARGSGTNAEEGSAVSSESAETLSGSGGSGSARTQPNEPSSPYAAEAARSSRAASMRGASAAPAESAEQSGVANNNITPR